MAETTGISISTKRLYAMLIDNNFNQHNALAAARTKWTQKTPSGSEYVMPTGADEVADLAFYDGTDTALPSTTEANTLFRGPTLPWTFSHAITYIDHATRARNVGKERVFGEMIERGEIAAESHMRLLNTNITQGDGTSNTISGFPDFVNTSGNYAGVTQASGFWASNAAVTVTGGVTNLTIDKVNNAINLSLGRIEGEPGLDVFTSWAVQRQLQTLGGQQQRAGHPAPVFDFGTKSDGSPSIRTQGFEWIFDRAMDVASDNTIYFIPPSVMDWIYDLNNEAKPWHDLTARISTMAITFLGFGNMACRRPNATAKITIA